MLSQVKGKAGSKLIRFFVGNPSPVVFWPKKVVMLFNPKGLHMLALPVVADALPQDLVRARRLGLGVWLFANLRTTAFASMAT